MGTTTPALMTFEEFAQLEDTPEDLELLEGESIRMPPPFRDHMRIVAEVFLRLRKSIDQRAVTASKANIGEVCIEMGFLLPSTPSSWLRPDVSISHPHQSGEKYYEGAPLIAFEVISEEDRAPALLRKVRLYLQFGAAEVWLIYPETREAYIYKPGVDAAVRETVRIHSDLLPGIEIPFDQFL